jgi:hypothetical protein
MDTVKEQMKAMLKEAFEDGLKTGSMAVLSTLYHYVTRSGDKFSKDTLIDIMKDLAATAGVKDLESEAVKIEALYTAKANN